MLFYKFSVNALPATLIHKTAQNFTETSLIVPLGVSFYSLVQISYLVECYKEKFTQKFGTYALMISFFPSLFAGPIVNYKTAHLQFYNLSKKRIPLQYISKGICLFCLGMAKKILIANPISIFTDQVFNYQNNGNVLTIFELVGAIWGFLVQMYFDFSGYSDMAIGLAICFGIQLPINFNSPFKARSVSDYITRWHMSLLQFNKVYIFAPIANFCRKKIFKSSRHKHLISWIIATQFIYVSIGLWHSPSWQVFFSSIIIGLVVVVAQVFQIIRAKLMKKPVTQQPKRPMLNGVLTLVMAAIIAAILKLKSFSAFKMMVINTDWNVKIPSDFVTWCKSLCFEPLSFFYPTVKFPLTFTLINRIHIPYFPFIVIASLIAIKGMNTMELMGVIPLKNGRYNRIKSKHYLILGIVFGIMLALFFLRMLTSSFKQSNIYGQF